MNIRDLQDDVWEVTSIAREVNEVFAKLGQSEPFDEEQLNRIDDDIEYL